LSEIDYFGIQDSAISCGKIGITKFAGKMYQGVINNTLIKSKIAERIYKHTLLDNIYIPEFSALGKEK